jgi:hypothetical protein
MLKQAIACRPGSSWDDPAGIPQVFPPRQREDECGDRHMPSLAATEISDEHGSSYSSSAQTPPRPPAGRPRSTPRWGPPRPTRWPTGWQRPCWPRPPIARAGTRRWWAALRCRRSAIHCPLPSRPAGVTADCRASAWRDRRPAPGRGPHRPPSPTGKTTTPISPLSPASCATSKPPRLPQDTRRRRPLGKPGPRLLQSCVRQTSITYPCIAIDKWRATSTPMRHRAIRCLFVYSSALIRGRQAPEP